MERNVISIRFTSSRSCPNNKGHVTESTKLARHVFIHERHQAHSPLRNIRLRNFNILEHQLWIVGEKPSKSFTAYSLVTVQAKRFTLFARRVELGQGRHCACRLPIRLSTLSEAAWRRQSTITLSDRISIFWAPQPKPVLIRCANESDSRASINHRIPIPIAIRSITKDHEVFSLRSQAASTSVSNSVLTIKQTKTKRRPWVQSSCFIIFSTAKREPSRIRVCLDFATGWRTEVVSWTIFSPWTLTFHEHWMLPIELPASISCGRQNRNF